MLKYVSFFSLMMLCLNADGMNVIQADSNHNTDNGTVTAEVTHDIDSIELPPALDMSLYEKYTDNEDVQVLLRQIEQFRDLAEKMQEEIKELRLKIFDYENKLRKADDTLDYYEHLVQQAVEGKSLDPVPEHLISE